MAVSLAKNAPNIAKSDAAVVVASAQESGSPGCL